MQNQMRMEALALRVYLKDGGGGGRQLLILPSLLIIPPDQRFWRVIQISAVNQFAKGYTGESPPPHSSFPPLPPPSQTANCK